MSKSYLKMTTQSLVERAKAIPSTQRKTSITKEEIELAVAWMKGDVTTSQVSRMMNTAPSNTIARMGSWLREAYRSGVIKVGEE
jgi:hypothetical protein